MAVTCGVGCRRGSDPLLLWLWRRPAAVALIQPLALECPYAAGGALEKDKKKKKEAAMCLLSSALGGGEECLYFRMIFFLIPKG